MVRPDLPPMPAAVRAQCRHPGIGEIDARAVIARYIAALRRCDGKRADAVAFYQDLKAGLR